jgi:hypothetical protein
VLASISKIEADRETIKSTTSSLEGMREGFKVGTQTLVDVLLVQQRLFQAYQQYAIDRYAFVINLLSLKLAAGTLSQCDLQTINYWLISGDDYSERKLEDIRRIPERIPKSKRHCWCQNNKACSSKNKLASNKPTSKWVVVKPKNNSPTKLAAKSTPTHHASTKKAEKSSTSTKLATKSKIITAFHHKNHPSKNLTHTALAQKHHKNITHTTLAQASKHKHDLA